MRIAVLALLVSAAANIMAQPPPTSGFVTVNGGVRLHCLDWSGRGEAVLLLTGLRDNAHVFDDFAPRFNDRFHVLGLTRRGFGESDKPASGYDTDTRVQDIRQFLDDRHVGRVILIGHSMAGEEMTAFAARYPDRVAKLVYLDAAVDRKPEAFLAGLSDPAKARRPGRPRPRRRARS